MASGSNTKGGKSGKAGKGKESAALKRFKRGRVSTDYSKHPF